ncbi:hypothetical protein [Amylibacter sp. SFDW26]|uniref:hypothetical protein n=1 Tax=Amylibacter sp. SFDW26 TaxID=2652722 RepID=UPI00186A24DC|nr:hypothetical protein [Amylibacter sp. SFDW26]
MNDIKGPSGDPKVGAPDALSAGAAQQELSKAVMEALVMTQASKIAIQNINESKS